MPLTHAMCSPFACTFELPQVTSIRVQGDERENLRRIQAETRRQERRQKLLYEAESRWRTAQPALLAGQASACCRDHIPVQSLRISHSRWHRWRAPNRGPHRSASAVHGCLVCSAKRNAVVAMRWSQLFERDVPLELLKDMEIQKDACDRIIQARARARRRAQWHQCAFCRRCRS